MIAQNTLSLPDGRLLSWYESGPTTGTPVIFCTGAGMSGSLGFGEEHLDKLGIRLLRIDRPGLGTSTMPKLKSFELWIEDVRFFISALNLSEPRCVGFSQGAPFAYALASAGLVSKLAIVSGQDDFSDSEMRAMLPEHAAGFVSLIQSGDQMFLSEFSSSADAEGFYKLIESFSSEKDKELYCSEPFKSEYKKCLSEGFSQGSQGYISDLVLALNPWPFKLEDISVPVDLWYGALDTNSTHSPDFGERLSQKIKISKRYFLDDEGGSLLWRKSYEILSNLINRER